MVNLNFSSRNYFFNLNFLFILKNKEIKKACTKQEEATNEHLNEVSDGTKQEQYLKEKKLVSNILKPSSSSLSVSSMSSVSVNGKLSNSGQLNLLNSRSPSPSFTRSYQMHQKQSVDHQVHKNLAASPLDLPPPATPPLSLTVSTSRSSSALTNAATNGAKQLNKLKRFLTTLQQFASDISPEINERVKHLILNLIVSLNYSSNIKYIIKILFMKQKS